MLMSKENLAEFRLSFNEAVQGLEKKYGVEIELGNISYNADSFTTKMSVANKGANEKKAKLQYMNFVKANPNFGLTAEMWESEVLCADGNKYTLAGVNPKARKNFMLIKSGDETYSCHPAFIIKKA